MSAGSSSVTVSEIATGLGFVELGRFRWSTGECSGTSFQKTLRQAVRYGLGHVVSIEQSALFDKRPQRQLGPHS